MIGKFLSMGDIYEPSSDIPLNWSDMRVCSDISCYMKAHHSGVL